MKVRMVITLDVDKEAWAEEFSKAPEEVRLDVKEYIGNQLQGGYLMGNGIIKDITWA